MNRREADALRQVLETLEHGPGHGWRELLEGGSGLDPGRDGKGLERRISDLALWRETWIRPTLAHLVERYWRPSRTARPLAPPVPSTLTRRIREMLLEGEAREANPGADEYPYWIGYYKGLARQALERLEELERSAQTGRLRL